MKSSLKRLTILIVLLLQIVLFTSYAANAESLFAKSHLSTLDDQVSYSPYGDESLDADVYSDSNEYDENEVFEDSEEVTLGRTKSLGLKELSFRIAMLLLILLGLSFIVKALLYKAEISGQTLFNQPKGFFNGITDQFSGSFANLEGLKLRQMLSLTKGQNLYLVELDGRKILLGGTHIGGIQYVADLSDVKENKISISDQIEENQKNESFFMNALQRCNPFQMQEKSNNLEPMITSIQQEQINSANFMAENISAKEDMFNPFKNTDKHMREIEKDREIFEREEIAKQEKQHDALEERRIKRRLVRKPFKRRVSFRQSLITG